MRMADDKKKQLKIAADLHRGMPTVELTDEDRVEVRVSSSLAEKLKENLKSGGKVRISLECLELEMTHNQNFGMIECSAGCASNIHGPSC
jgi:hypothetical protein